MKSSERSSTPLMTPSQDSLWARGPFNSPVPSVATTAQDFDDAHAEVFVDHDDFAAGE
jgi:hypothetical protein